MEVWLAVAAALALTARAQDAQQVQAAFTQAYERREWTQAIEHGHKLLSLRPGNNVLQYNLACVYARDGQVESALVWLRKAAANGFDRTELLKSDADLDSLRAQPLFARIIDQVSRNREKQRARLRAAVEKRPPLIVRPPGYDAGRPAPLIIALHGYGGEAEEMLAVWREPAAEFGALLAAPQAALRVPGAGGNWGDAAEAELLLELALEHIRGRHKLDPQHVVLTGFSQGAYIAQVVAVRHPDQFAGAIPVAGPYLPQLDTPQQTQEGTVPRFCFLCGSGDTLLEQTRQAASDYQAAGYPVQLRVFQSAGHQIPRSAATDLREALQFVLRQHKAGG